MLDIRRIRQNPQELLDALQKRNSKIDLTEFLQKEEERRTLLSQVETLKARRNDESKRIAQIKREGGDAQPIMDEMRQLGDQVTALDAQIKQIEILTEKIFAYVREHPQDIGEIRQFLNYYLPTTIKFLEQYVVLQNQGMRMGNIDEGMRKIESMLDKVIVAFQRQLDGLFESSVVDITADIQVMEQMMASEGLTGKDF